MLAHAEEGLHFYDLSRTVRIHKYLWQETQLGSINPFNFARLPYFKFIYLFQTLKIPSFRIQQIVFLVLIFTPLISTSMLAKSLFPGKPNVFYTSASLFYFFNLFTMSQVLQRFIYPNIFAWSYLPLFLYLWVRWLDTTKKKYLVLFLVSSILFSNTFGLTVFVLTLWIPAFLLWLNNYRVVPALVAILLWGIVNLFWLYPLLFIRDTSYAQNLNVVQNIVSLVDVSKYYPSDEIILLKQKYYFGSGAELSKIYSRPYNLAIGSGIFLLLAAGVVWSIKFRQGRLVAIWLFISWFLVKGANSPYGYEFYNWLFTKLPFTVLLRNPYEKLGIVFLLPYSLLLSLGLSRIKPYSIKITIIFVVCFIYLRPYWTNQIFANYVTEVPKSYQQANSYLNSQSNLRLLHLPYLLNAGTKFTWGYQGEEPSNYLFDRSSLSVTYYSPSDPYPLIYQHLRSPNMYKLLQFFSVDSIVLHHDIIKTQDYQEDVSGTVAIINTWKNIQLTKRYPELDIYELDKNLNLGLGYLSNNVTTTASLKEGLDLVVNSEKFNSQKDSFVTSNDQFSLSQSNLPSYSITKISPIHYKYSINNAAGRYILILSNNFNSHWMAKIDNKVLSNHFQINGYANGWLIDKPGDYVIDISFKTWPWD